MSTLAVSSSRLGASLLRLRRAKGGRALAPAIRAYKADPQQQHHEGAKKEGKKDTKHHEGSSASLQKPPAEQAAAVARPSSGGRGSRGLMMSSPMLGLEAFFPPSAASLLRQVDQMMAGDPFFSRGALADAGADDAFFGLSPRRASRHPQQHQQMQQMQQMQQQMQPPALLPLDISETDGAYLVKADLPGVDRRGVAVEVSPDGQVLTLSGSRFDEVREGGGEQGEGKGAGPAERPLRLERRWSSWSRSLALSPDIDAGAVKANLRDGVLVVELPKVAPAALGDEEQAPPRRIPVE